MTSNECTDPQVTAAAELVLRNIINGGHSPWDMRELAGKAQESVLCQDITVLPAGATDFSPTGGHGISWMTITHNRVDLLIPDFRDGEGQGWQGDPHVLLVNNAHPEDAIRFLDALALELVTCRHCPA